MVGCHLIGPEVTELISQISLLRASRATATDVINAVYPHPTLSEAIKEAALASKGQALHFWFEDGRNRKRT